MGRKDENSPWRFTIKSVQKRQRQIGQELERLWGSVVKEPVPEDMLELLRKLDEKDRGPADS